MLSQSIEDYLKVIYKLQHGSDAPAQVTTSILAERMGVTAASATNMIKKLAEVNLLEYAPYKGVVLREAGEKIALETIRHHRLIELYLSEALGYSWDAVDAEAERLEHAISEKLEERIDSMLGHPTIGAHGEPIPDKNGQVEEQTYARLSDIDRGQRAVVKRVSDRDPAMLRYMDDMGLQLNTVVKVCEKAPFKGPLTLLIETDQPQTLGLEVARHIFVDLVR